MTRQEADRVLKQAIDRLVEEQRELLDLDVTERALSHHLATYLQELVPNDLRVDAEYNRHRHDPKRLHLPPREALDREIRATTVFPDIIVHERNTDARNYVVVEVKKPRENLAYDDLKLRQFREELGYLHTAHLVLGLNGDGNLVRELTWVDG